jgi:hypothetical protein
LKVFSYFLPTQELCGNIKNSEHDPNCIIFSKEVNSNKKMANMASNLGAKLKLVQIFATLIKVGML